MKIVQRKNEILCNAIGKLIVQSMNVHFPTNIGRALSNLPSPIPSDPMDKYYYQHTLSTSINFV